MIPEGTSSGPQNNAGTRIPPSYKVPFCPRKGRFEVACADEKRSLVTPDSMAVDFDEGFDPHNVLPDVRRQGDGTILVKDALGHTAKLTNCTA